MSKKDKAKFRKRIKAQLLEEMARSNASTKPMTPAMPQKVNPVNPVMPVQTQAAPFSKEISKTDVTLETPAEDPLKYVRYDLKKSAIIIGSIIAIIFICWIVDLKTGFVLKTGDYLFKTLNLNA